jgi:hypothetical protein
VLGRRKPDVRAEDPNLIMSWLQRLDAKLDRVFEALEEEDDDED